MLETSEGGCSVVRVSVLFGAGDALGAGDGGRTTVPDSQQAGAGAGRDSQQAGAEVATTA
ncbi:MAG TPA: hypothetical protein VKP11_11435 [Frankiaceae bacterium]|nr:hypothetical protein [Frankiaceae bacterium]